MAKKNQRRLTVTIPVFLTCLQFTAEATAQNGNRYEVLSKARGEYQPIRIVDSESMPVEKPSRVTGWGIKTLYKNPDGGQLRILYIPPGAEGATVHYHEFHEWAYMMAGDFTNNESTTPDQFSGPLQRFREGNFLSRPPFSLHGGERGRQKFMASQIGAEILIMEESAVGAGSYTVDPAVRNLPNFGVDQPGGMRYNPDYKKIQHWATPRIIDTLDKMPWQPVESAPGLNVKHLVDDPSHGFRADMWFLEAGAATPRGGAAAYYKQAHQFNFMIAGDLKIRTLDDPGGKSQYFDIGKHYLVERPPMSIAGLAEEGATQGGAVWLQVTYAKGTRWTDVPTPIEEPTLAD